MRTIHEIIHDYIVFRGDTGADARKAMIQEILESHDVQQAVEQAYGQGLRDGAASK